MLAYENFAAWVLSTHTNQYNKLAIVDDHSTLTYGELATHVELFAGYLQAQGYKPQQRMIISMDDCVSWPVVFLGALYVGMNPVLVSNIMLPADIERIIKISDAAVIVSDHQQSWSIPCINTDTVLTCESTPLKNFYRYHPDEMCLWLLSSGSTGEPKCIVNRHANLYNILNLVAPVAKIDNHSAVLSTAKMSWTYGFNLSVTLSLGQGATAHVIKGIPAPTKIYNHLRQYNITHLFSVPSILVSVLKHHNDCVSSKLRVFSGGEPLPAAVAETFLDRYSIKVCEVFGMSETTTTHCLQTDDNWEIGTVGQPLPGIKHELRDSQGQLVEPGQVGELYVNSPCQASLYWKDWQKTREVFQGPWVRTGDQCYVNPQGNLVFLGRNDDLIKIKGLYVAPVEIENAIMNLANVEDCTVVHSLNANGLAELHAFIIASNHIGPDQIQQQLQQYLPTYKIPRYINFVSQLPKTLTNKKIRSILRKGIA